MDLENRKGIFVKYACKWCKNHIEFDVENCGEWLACPHCNRQIRLPAADQLKPVGGEKAWYDEAGVITYLKCPTCRRMLFMTHEHQDGQEFVRFPSHTTNSGFQCYASFTRYKVSNS